MSDAPESGGRVHDIVLGTSGGARTRVVLYALCMAGVLHAGGVALAIGLSRNAEPARPPRTTQPLVMFEHVVELEPPPPAVAEPPPPPPPPPPPVAAKPPPEKSRPEKPKEPAPEPPPEAAPEPEPAVAAAPPDAPEPPPEQPPSEPPPAAQAGQVLAAAPTTASAPPSFAIAAGQGQRYVGGTTSARGTGTQANHTGQVGSGTGTGLSRARPAALRSRSPDCGWPEEAEDSDLEEAFVTMQVALDAQGGVTGVRLLSDPGYGFGRRMEWCARARMKFEPARDPAGNPVAGSTPPLRVRFVRDE